MPKYVRVTDLDTGHKLSVLESEVANGNYRELKGDAVNELGDPLPPEHNAVKPAASTEGQSATNQKES
jgi:hypothetical protein